MTVEVKYSCLREEFLSITQSNIDDRALKVLKEYYADYIHSKRKLGLVNDLRTLLKILEKRDVLSYSKIEPLDYISKNFLNDPLVQKKIEDYKFYLQNTQYLSFCDMYQDENEFKDKDTKEVRTNEPECQATSQSHATNFRSCSEQESKLQQMVLLQIGERIGRSWRDTVRYLGIPEYQIDAIQEKYPMNMKEQSFEALKLYMYQYSTDKWKLNLVHALEKARRRDLKELAEKLIMYSRNE
ncbi:fas-associated death domain protein [Hylaeus anthracinus]|uniref:fas-associated death domain protein n=1 Tax=Hylaeus anthracinus TaxID=313031 RepID=UPI0023B8E8B8|nr:fas-associated death domain protein [Hylaeus anthracinus]